MSLGDAARAVCRDDRPRMSYQRWLEVPYHEESSPYRRPYLWLPAWAILVYLCRRGADSPEMWFLRIGTIVAILGQVLWAIWR